MVGGDVVGHVVEDQAQPALGEFGPRDGQRGRAAEALVDDVPADAVGRTDHVTGFEVRQGRVERVP
jgi:hypothetical protein